MILLNNGYRSMLQFMGERSMYFHKYFDFCFKLGGLPNGICFALYHKPLSKIVYHESAELIAVSIFDTQSVFTIFLFAK